ncbi:amidohydrolase [Ochrobactrum daejeonense]|nr:amidohydrolase [Brucella daejeonensis]
MCLACNPGMLAVVRHAATRRDFLKYMGGAAVSAFAATAVEPALGIGRAYAADDPADVIFRGGPILSINPAARAEALAIRGERILAIGSMDEVDAYRGSATRIVDLDGRTLMPGLIDPHMHSTFVAMDDWLDVGPISTPTFDQVWNKLRDAVARAKEGEWVRAQLFDPSITKGAHVPTLKELDELAPNNPFFMMESNGHISYVNSKALAIAGVSDSSADLPESRFVKDANGKLTGRLEEPPSFMPFLGKMPMPTAVQLQEYTRRMMDHAASVGCTSLHDCGVGMLAAEHDVALLDAVMAKKPPIRYRGMLVSTAMDQWEKLGFKPGRGTDMYRLDGIKAWADGSNQAKTGYQRENYLGTDSRGAMNYTPEELTEAIRRAHKGGWQVGVHANGDAAIDATIAAYETVLKETPRDDHRHRIEHCSVFHPEQMAKMKELGLSPSFLIGHVHWWGKAFRDEILGPDRAKFYDPCASALAAGLIISFHSDWNVTPIEPLRYVENAVTRIMNDGGDVFFPDERIPVDAALRAVTIDAAWHCRMDDIVGSLEPGKYADLTILEQDPTTVDPATISKIKVSETWLSGEERHSA